MNTTVRIARQEDALAISQVLAASWKSAYKGLVADDYLDSLREDHLVAFLIKGMADNSLFAMLLEENSQLIGASILKKTDVPSIIELTAIYLLPGTIGQGYGYTFFRAIEAEMIKRGYTRCVLDVLVSNSRAIRFYEKNGFVDDGQTIAAKLGNNEYTCRIMRKQLNGGHL